MTSSYFEPFWTLGGWGILGVHSVSLTLLAPNLQNLSFELYSPSTKLIPAIFKHFFINWSCFTPSQCHMCTSLYYIYKVYNVV